MAGKKQKSEKACDPLLRDQLRNVAQLRSSQDQIVWQVFSIFTAANAVLLSSVIKNSCQENSQLLRHVVCAGLTIAIVWLMVQTRAFAIIKRLENLTGKIEIELKIPVHLAIEMEINKADYVDFMSCSLRARFVMPIFVVCIIIFWAIWLIDLAV